MTRNLAIACLLLAGEVPAVSAQDDIGAASAALIRRHYFHGVSYSEAKALGREAILPIVGILGSPDDREYWANAVVALGFIKSSLALKPLVRFLETADGEVDIHHFRALLSVPFAIGCIAGGGDEAALVYLRQLATGGIPDAGRWQFKGSPGREALARHAIIGLAMSGRHEARETLLELHSAEQWSGQTDSPRNYLLIEALEAHERVAALGLDEYYTRSTEPTTVWQPSVAEGLGLALSAVHHVETTLTNAQLDAALEQGTRLLFADNEHCSDVPCSREFFRGSAVGTFGAVGDGFNVIDSAGKLNALFALGASIKVVAQLSYCGAFNPSIIGCAPIGSPPNMVVQTGVSADVYVHEYGHNAGLGHRDDCEGNIMYSSAGGLTGALLPWECSAMGGRPSTALSGTRCNDLTIGDSPYWVMSDVEIPVGCNLIVEPGVEIQFRSGRRLTARGTLSGDGSLAPITLLSNQDPSVRFSCEGEFEVSAGGILQVD